jgi:hypothetical protein
MRPIRDLLRQSVSVGIAVLMLGVTVAVPMLERGEMADRPVAESSHAPGTCPRAHDHSVCTQVGANVSAPSDAPEQRVTPALLASWTPGAAPLVRTSTFDDGHPTRAPPLT